MQAIAILGTMKKVRRSHIKRPVRLAPAEQLIFDTLKLSGSNGMELKDLANHLRPESTPEDGARIVTVLLSRIAKKLPKLEDSAFNQFSIENIGFRGKPHYRIKPAKLKG